MGSLTDHVRELFDKLVRALEPADVAYALCGGWAVGLWGYTRLTTDIDLVVAQDDLIRLCKAAETAGFTLVAGLIPLPSQGIEFYRVSAVVEAEIVPLDIYPVPRDHPYLRNRVWAPWRDMEVPVLAIDDLIGMKSTSPRPKDKGDIDELERIRKENAARDA